MFNDFSCFVCPHLEAFRNDVCLRQNEIGHSIASSITKLLFLGPVTLSIDTIQVGTETISSCIPLGYLDLPFVESFNAASHLIVNSLKEKLRKSYAYLPRLEGQFDQRTLDRPYNVLFLHRMCSLDAI